MINVKEFYPTDLSIGSVLARNVRTQLSEKIRGRVKTEYDRLNGVLVVYIYTDELECWRYLADNLHNTNSTDLTFAILCRYKRDILDKFFR